MNTLYHNSLELTTNKKFFSPLSGEHNSIFTGNGLDFRELREYNSSDDIRHINWKVTARMNTPCVNVFNDDKRLHFVFVFLVSGSIYFGSLKSKKHTMVDVLSNLSYAALSKKDFVSTLFFSHKAEAFNYFSKNKEIIERDIKIANRLNPLFKNVHYKNLEQYLLGAIKQKSLIFLIGDFLEIPVLKLLNAKHELFAVVVRDRFEEDIKLLGEFTIKDTSSGMSEDLFLDESTLLKYEELLKTHDFNLFSYFAKLKIKSTKIYTDDDVVQKLTQLVKN
jgi:uncharacterized protein (DUF58 family)